MCLACSIAEGNPYAKSTKTFSFWDAKNPKDFLANEKQIDYSIQDYNNSTY